MGKNYAQLCHLIHLIQAFACKEVKTIQVVAIGLDGNLTLGLTNTDNSFKQGTLALLNILSHRVEVGSECYACGEDTLVLLTLALAIELFPPLGNVLQAGLVGGENFDFVTFAVERIAHCGILSSDVLLERYALATSLLHILGTTHQLFDVDTCGSKRKKTYGSEYRETTTNIVGDDIGVVTLGSREGFQCTTSSIGNACDAHLGLLFTIASLNLGFDKTESDCGLGGGTALADNNGSNRVLFGSLQQLGSVGFAEVVACKYDIGVLALLVEEVERAAHCIEYGFGSKIRATNADNDDNLCLLGKASCGCFNGGNLLSGDARRKIYPTEEVVTCALAGVKKSVCALCGSSEREDFALAGATRSVFNV